MRDAQVFLQFLPYDNRLLYWSVTAGGSHRSAICNMDGVRDLLNAAELSPEFRSSRSRTPSMSQIATYLVTGVTTERSLIDGEPMELIKLHCVKSKQRATSPLTPHVHLRK